jgi:YD repeat-containing protein
LSIWARFVIVEVVIVGLQGTDTSGIPALAALFYLLKSVPLTYGLKISTPALPNLGQVSLGDTISGSISEKGQRNNYTFQGVAGHQLFFDGLTSYTDGMDVRIIDPAGRQVLFTNSYYNNGPDSAGLVLSQNGAYRLEVDGSAADSTGSYAFRVLDKSSATEINFDTDYSGTSGNSGRESKLYRFIASAGQGIYLDTALGQSSASWTLYTPSGQILISDYSSNTELKLPTSGEYLLAFNGTGAANQLFQFHLATLLQTKAELTLNQPVIGTLTKRGQQNVYTFSAQAGQRFLFDGLTGASGIKARLVTPSQASVWATDYDVSSDSIPLTVTETGQYQLIIDGDRATTGGYSFRFQNLADAAQLPIGTAVNGTIDANSSIALYRFDGQVGQTLNFDWTAAFVLPALSWTLYGNNNQLVGQGTYFGAPDFRATLPATGVYTLVISKTSSAPANYGFTVVNETPSAVVAVSGLDQLVGETLFSSRSGSIIAGQIIDQTFTAPAGTRIYFDSKNSATGVMVSVLNPDGSTVFSTSASDDNGPILLSQSGTFTIRIQGATAGSAGAYNFSVMEVLTKAPGFQDNVRRLTLNAEITKPLSPGRTTDILSFEGTVGQHLLFDGILPDGANFYTAKIDAKLIGPSGQVIFDFKSADYPYITGAVKDFAPFTLMESGTYNLLIAGQQDTAADYRFKMWDLAEAEPLLLNRTSADNLLRGTDTNLYKITGTAGQRLFFNSIEGRNSDVWKLYRLGNNQELIARTLDSDFEYTLPADGEYILAIQGNSTTPGTYRFAVQAIQEPKATIVPGQGESGGTQADELGTYQVRLKVSDGKGGLDEQTFKIRVNPKEGNAIPYIVSEAKKYVSTSATYRYQVDAIDADHDVLSYTLVKGPSGMSIDFASGAITWYSPVAGTHQIKIRVADTNGGFDYQSFDLIVDGNANARVIGSVYNDLDQSGTRKITNPNNLTPYTGVTIGDQFKDNYTAYNLGLPKGLPIKIGAMAFYQDTNGIIDPNTLLVAGSIESCGGVVFKVKVQRGDDGHIIAFDDDFDPETPYVAQFFLYSPYIGAGLVYDPINNTLIKSSVKAGYSGLAVVPVGIAGAGELKETSPYGSAFYTVVNGTKTQTALVPNYSTGIVYVPANAPNFDLGAELLMSNRLGNSVTAYQLDGDGNPTGTGTPFLTDFDAAMGSVRDPITGDFLFSSAGKEALDSTGKLNNTIIAVRGLGKPTGNEPGLGNWLVYVDSNQDGVREANEQFTYTDSQGNYAFNLAPGSYQIREELQAGWIQTAPSNPKYQAVTLASKQILYGLNFGNFGSPANVPNLDPKFYSSPVLQATTEQRYIYRSLASDLNGDVLTFELVQGPQGLAVSTQGVVSWQPSDQQLGAHQVILKVSDGKGGVDLQAFNLTVQQGNRRPVFTSVQPEGDAVAGKTYRYKASAFDADGDALTYAIVPNPDQAKVFPDGMTLNSATGELSWTPTTAQVGGAYIWGPDHDIVAPWQVTLKVSDGKGGESYQQVNLLVDAPVANRAPVVISQPRTNINPGTTYIYNVQAVDPDGDPLVYSLAQGPQGMTLNQGIISWTPTTTQLGNYNVVVNVSDGQLTTAQTWSIATLSTTSVPNVLLNHAPVVLSAPPLVTNVGDSYEYAFVANDSDNDLLFWSLESGPAGMTVNAAKLDAAASGVAGTKVGKLRWQPDATQIGEHEVRIKVVDAYGAFSTQIFQLRVTGINAPPDIVSLPVTQIGVGDRYAYQVVATDPEQDALVFSLSRKPEGMQIHPTTGLISWQPIANQLGSQSVEVVVQDPSGAQSIQRFTIVVAAQTVNHAPAITSTPVFLAGVGSAYTYQVVGTDPDAGNTLTYQLLSGPSGMAINPTTGLLSWNTFSAGIYQVVVGAVDQGGLGGAQSFTLTARQNHAPVIVSTSATAVTLGTTYRYDVRATDADGDALTYGLDAGSVARGLVMDERGRISWTPRVADSGTSQPMTITVTDAQGARATQVVNLQVVADNEAPKVNLIATTNLLNVGQSVTFEAQATDNIGVVGLTLVVNGQAVALDGQGRATVKFSTVQTVTAVATAIDGANLSTTSAPLLVDVVEPSLGFDPLLNLDLSLLPEGVIKAPTPIRGSVGGNGFARYELQIASLDSDDFKVVASGNAAVTNGVLGTVDPSLLLNDTYRLRLVAYGTNGSAELVEDQINIEGELKLGNFRLSFTDLAVPVTGIPITLTRTYDTLTANQQNDFGYGWRMEFRDTNLRTSLGKRSEEDAELGRYPAFKDNTKVYITLPGGKREAYTFKAKQVEYFQQGTERFGTGIFAKYLYEATFVPEAGSTNKLTVEGGIFTRNASGTYSGFQGQPFNPADALFGGVYVLTSKDGTAYRIDATTGSLLSVKDTNGNTLTYSDDAIVSSTGQKITFERDVQGRIVSVKDPTQEYIRYEYDASGDLVSVTDRTQNKTRMVYDTSYDDPNYPGTADVGRTKRAHYLREIIDPLGRSGARSEYDETTGRLKQVTDVYGKAVNISYDPNNSKQAVKDQLGYETTYVYDDRGNVLTETDSKGGTTTRTYDADNNLLTEADADGVKTTYTYDGQRNMLTIEDAAGHITHMSYDARGRTTSIVSPTGLSVSSTYDSRGNLIESIDSDSLKSTYRTHLVSFSWLRGALASA